MQLTVSGNQRLAGRFRPGRNGLVATALAAALLSGDVAMIPA
jgi:hypothetical protein